MRIVVVPSTLALLPEYAGLEDPVPDLRAAVRDAVAWLPDRVSVLTSDGSPAASVNEPVRTAAFKSLSIVWRARISSSAAT